MRSLSSRGHLGGLCRAAGQVVDLLDACGWDWVIVETVGVGQSELSICEVADTVVVVLTPESGDTVQTMKAGLLEVADLFVVNKADRPGADCLCGSWKIPIWTSTRASSAVVELSALQGLGLEEFYNACRAWRVVQDQAESLGTSVALRGACAPWTWLPKRLGRKPPGSSRGPPIETRDALVQGEIGPTRRPIAGYEMRDFWGMLLPVAIWFLTLKTKRRWRRFGWTTRVDAMRSVET